ncbi:hypothetical protein N7456_010535 [Penicillium angulare]|uniref:Uncharacterized protein n=1 Tax=Penicillium angulare TaxID=116970 RepID=A0A9W9F6U4_9EURO|nr:hypothetical protein N7456_010535 [Penicillium angulare]
MERINKTIFEAIEEHHAIRILGDLPTERLDSENYLSSTPGIIKDLTTLWEKKAQLRFLAVEVYPKHSYVALDFNNDKYDFETADKDMIILPKQRALEIFRHVPSDRRVAKRIADLHDGEGQNPTPFLEDHIKGVTFFSPRSMLPPLTSPDQEYDPIPECVYFERRYND